MKFNKIGLFLIYASLSFSLFIYSQAVKAQLISGVGISGGITYAKEKLNYTYTGLIGKPGYVPGINGDFFVEFFQNDYVRFVSELQFNQKGTIEHRSSHAGLQYLSDVKDRLNYLSFNNYLKIRYELLTIIPYFLVGPRVEYLLSSNRQISTDHIHFNDPAPLKDFKQIHFSIAVGGGIELVSYSEFKFFTEFYYNPDISFARLNDNYTITNTSFELRIGLKYTVEKAKQTCPRVYK